MKRLLLVLALVAAGCGEEEAPAAKAKPDCHAEYTVVGAGPITNSTVTVTYQTGVTPETVTESITELPWEREVVLPFGKEGAATFQCHGINSDWPYCALLITERDHRGRIVTIEAKNDMEFSIGLVSCPRDMPETHDIVLDGK